MDPNSFTNSTIRQSSLATGSSFDESGREHSVIRDIHRIDHDLDHDIQIQSESNPAKRAKLSDTDRDEGQEDRHIKQLNSNITAVLESQRKQLLHLQGRLKSYTPRIHRRIVPTRDQTAVLDAAFKENPFPKDSDIEDLSIRVGLPAMKVKRHISARRIKAVKAGEMKPGTGAKIGRPKKKQKVAKIILGSDSDSDSSSSSYDSSSESDSDIEAGSGNEGSPSSRSASSTAATAKAKGAKSARKALVALKQILRKLVDSRGAVSLVANVSTLVELLGREKEPKARILLLNVLLQSTAPVVKDKFVRSGGIQVLNSMLSELTTIAKSKAQVKGKEAKINIDEDKDKDTSHIVLLILKALSKIPLLDVSILRSTAIGRTVNAVSRSGAVFSTEITALAKKVVDVWKKKVQVSSQPSTTATTASSSSGSGTVHETEKGKGKEGEDGEHQHPDRTMSSSSSSNSGKKFIVNVSNAHKPVQRGTLTLYPAVNVNVSSVGRSVGSVKPKSVTSAPPSTAGATVTATSPSSASKTAFSSLLGNIGVRSGSSQPQSSQAANTNVSMNVKSGEGVQIQSSVSATTTDTTATATDGMALDLSPHIHIGDTVEMGNGLSIPEHEERREAERKEKERERKEQEKKERERKEKEEKEKKLKEEQEQAHARTSPTTTEKEKEKEEEEEKEKGKEKKKKKKRVKWADQEKSGPLVHTKIFELDPIELASMHRLYKSGDEFKKAFKSEKAAERQLILDMRRSEQEKARRLAQMVESVPWAPPRPIYVDPECAFERGKESDEVKNQEIRESTVFMAIYRRSEDIPSNPNVLNSVSLNIPPSPSSSSQRIDESKMRSIPWIDIGDADPEPVNVNVGETLVNVATPSQSVPAGVSLPNTPTSAALSSISDIDPALVQALASNPAILQVLLAQTQSGQQHGDVDASQVLEALDTMLKNRK